MASRGLAEPSQVIYVQYSRTNTGYVVVTIKDRANERGLVVTPITFRPSTSIATAAVQCKYFLPAYLQESPTAHCRRHVRTEEGGWKTTGIT
jgi:hypothetical protein